jgi:hypothetical protein
LLLLLRVDALEATIIDGLAGSGAHTHSSLPQGSVLTHQTWVSSHLAQREGSLVEEVSCRHARGVWR